MTYCGVCIAETSHAHCSLIWFFRDFDRQMDLASSNIETACWDVRPRNIQSTVKELFWMLTNDRSWRMVRLQEAPLAVGLGEMTTPRHSHSSCAATATGPASGS